MVEYFGRLCGVGRMVWFEVGEGLEVRLFWVLYVVLGILDFGGSYWKGCVRVRRVFLEGGERICIDRSGNRRLFGRFL